MEYSRAQVIYMHKCNNRGTKANNLDMLRVDLPNNKTANPLITKIKKIRTRMEISPRIRIEEYSW